MGVVTTQHADRFALLQPQLEGEEPFGVVMCVVDLSLMQKRRLEKL